MKKKPQPKSAKPPQPDSDVCTLYELSVRVGIAERTLSRAVQRGILPRLGRGKYSYIDCATVIVRRANELAWRKLEGESVTWSNVLD